MTPTSTSSALLKLIGELKQQQAWYTEAKIEAEKKDCEDIESKAYDYLAEEAVYHLPMLIVLAEQSVKMVEVLEEIKHGRKHELDNGVTLRYTTTDSDAEQISSAALSAFHSAIDPLLP